MPFVYSNFPAVPPFPPSKRLLWRFNIIRSAGHLCQEACLVLVALLGNLLVHPLDLSHLSGKALNPVILLLRSLLVLLILLALRQVVQCLVAPQLVFLVSRHHHCLQHRCLVLLHHQDLGVQILLLEAHHHHHLLEGHLYLGRSLLLEVLGLVVKQVHLEAHFNNHSLHSVAIYLVLLHHLVLQANLHLVVLAPLLLGHQLRQHLALQAPLHLELPAPPPLVQHLVQLLEAQELPLVCQVPLLLGQEEHLDLQALLSLVLVAPLDLALDLAQHLVLQPLNPLELLALRHLVLLALQLLGLQLALLRLARQLLVPRLLISVPAQPLVKLHLILEVLVLGLHQLLLVPRLLHLEDQLRLLLVVALGSQIWEEVELLPTRQLLKWMEALVVHQLGSWNQYLPWQFTKTKAMKS